MTTEAAAVAHLKQLQADRARSGLFSAYVATLIEDAGWGVESLAGLLGVSRQSISNRRKQGRELRQEHAAELAGLPLPPAPKPVGQTKSGLRVPPAEEIAAREAEWLEQQFGGALPAAELPARLKLVAGLLEEVEGQLTRLRQQRADLAWTLICFDPQARRGLQKAGHWQPDEFFAARTQALAPASELKDLSVEGWAELASQRGITAIEGVEQTREKYFAVTTSLIAAQARRRVATQMRDDLIRRYVRRDAHGRWKGVTEVAAWIGRTQSQVTQICDAGN